MNRNKISKKRTVGFPRTPEEIELEDMLDEISGKKKRRGVAGEYSDSEKAAYIVTIIKAIKNEGYSLRMACRKFAVSISTVRRWREEDKKIEKLFTDALNESVEFILDLAEYGLVSHLLKKDKDMIRYCLNTKGRTRGYVQGNNNLGDVLEDEANRKRAESVQHKFFKALGAGINNQPKET